MSEAVKRPYRSERRREQAEQTRDRILDSAADVFCRRGYERASIAAIASAAGVADETVYSHFKNKRTLLGELVQRAVRGQDPRPVPEQQAPQALVATGDQHAQIELFAADVAARLQRAAPLVAVVSAAAPGEPELATLLERLHARRASNLRALIDALRRNGPLRVPEKEAVQTVWALASPELYRLFTGLGGWSQRRYTAWLASSLKRLLLTD